MGGAPKAMCRPVMHDVARLAGVSHQTVSRVVNGSAHVSDDARRKVEIAIAQLGYRPNAAARALVTRRTATLGVVSVETMQYGPSHALLGIARAARAAGYSLRLATLPEPSRATMVATLGEMVEEGVDGIAVVAPVRAAVDAAHAFESGLPMVLVDAGVDDAVGVDQLLGGRLATRHLLDLGHPTVFHVRGPAGWLDADLRTSGWLHELTLAGARVPAPIVGDWSASSGYVAGRALARNPDVSAVFVANDQMACGLLRAFYEHGVEVPGRVSVVGFDDAPEAGFLHVPLTTVRQDFLEVGRSCVEQLARRLAGAPGPAPSLIAPSLVVRSSTDSHLPQGATVHVSVDRCF